MNLIHPSTRELKSDYIVPESRDEDLIEYSTNLLGWYEVDHLKLRIDGARKAYFNGYWTPPVNVDDPVDSVDYVEDENFGYFLLPIKEFHDITIPFTKGEKEKTKYEARLLVKHKPVNCNFWHFEVRWHTNNDNELLEIKKKSKAQWQKTMTGHLKSLIKEHFIGHMPSDVSCLTEKEFRD